MIFIQLWHILEAYSQAVAWGNALPKFRAIALLPMLLAAPVVAAVDPIAASSDEAPPAQTWTWFGDLLARGDRVTDIPRPVESDVHRVFSRGRFGVLYDPIPNLEFGVAIKLADSSIPNSEDRSYNNNERSNDVAADQLFVRWRPSENTALLAGKAVFPLELTPMVWDQDLRPIGASVDTSFAVDAFDRFQFIAGYFAGDLPYGDDSRIAAVQAAYRWHEGQPTNASIIVSYLDFSDLEQLTAEGLARTNRHVGDELISDYHLLDMQLVGRMRPGDWPLEARIDLLRNLGADTASDAGRISLTLGDRRQPNGWEFGLAAQRIQRDAAMAAFNSDDWWFHSFARGVMPWVGYGINSTWSMRLAEFHERRDGVNTYTDRILLDVYAQW